MYILLKFSVMSKIQQNKYGVRIKKKILKLISFFLKDTMNGTKKLIMKIQIN